jgi:hypothetical protein
MAGRWVPNAPEVSREALTVIAGAIVAAWVIGNLPALRAWLQQQWGGTPPNSST